MNLINARSANEKQSNMNISRSTLLTETPNHARTKSGWSIWCSRSSSKMKYLLNHSQPPFLENLTWCKANSKLTETTQFANKSRRTSSHFDSFAHTYVCNQLIIPKQLSPRYPNQMFQILAGIFSLGTSVWDHFAWEIRSGSSTLQLLIGNVFLRSLTWAIALN